MKAFKVVVLGDFGVGKTSLIRRYVDDAFSDEYRATIGVHLMRHSDTILVGNAARQVDLILWDIEGEALPSAQTVRYLAGAAGAIVVGDLTRDSFLDTMEAAAALFAERRPGRPLVFAFNKCDLAAAPAGGSAEVLAERFATEAVETSARTGDRVTPMFRRLCHRLVQQEDGA